MARTLSRWKQRYEHKVALLQSIVLKDMEMSKHFQKSVCGVDSKLLADVKPRQLEVDYPKPGFIIISADGIKKFRRMNDALNVFASM